MPPEFVAATLGHEISTCPILVAAIELAIHLLYTILCEGEVRRYQEASCVGNLDGDR